MARIRDRIKRALFEFPYSLYFFIFAILFFLFNVWINESYHTLLNLGTLRLWFAASFVFLIVFVSLLFSLTLNLVILRVKELGSINSKETSFAFIGSLVGILGGSCAACLAGIFPALIAFFGISFSLIDLPLKGLELQIISVLLLIFSINSLSKPPVCKV